MSATGPDAELGLIVGKAVGNAVCRNKVRRRLREIVRHYDSNSRASRPHAAARAKPLRRALVIRALPAAAVARFDELDRDVSGRMRKLERRLGLIAQ